MRDQVNSQADCLQAIAGDVSGLLIVNADDWGCDQPTTEAILRCVRRGTVSAVSAMVFMADSERAAAMAGQEGIDAGLHLNFTTPFSARRCPSRLAEHQQELARYLRRHRLAQMLMHPGLFRPFEYVVAAQLDEFRRLYGTEPDRLDGHHHMHLCANVVLRKLLPAGTLVRRNFSFQRGEKGTLNRMYRRFIDGRLVHRHHVCDFLFSLAPLEPESRIQRIFSLARRFVVEVETHPIQPAEYRFLAGGEFLRQVEGLRIASSQAMRRSGHLGGQPL